MNREVSADRIISFPAKLAPPPIHIIPSIPELNALLSMSEDKLFFIAYNLPNSMKKEWQLVRVAYSVTLAMHPHCVEDGRYLVVFYIRHPEDASFNAPNQRYWLDYHHGPSTIRSDHAKIYHLIQPTTDSDRYAIANGLIPYRQWVYLHQKEIFIHGPFDFQVMPNGRKSRDRVSSDDWQVLHNCCDMFENTPPPHDLHNYCSVHCSSLFHTSLTGLRVS